MATPPHAGKISDIFVFDGDCGICTKSVEFLKHVVGAKFIFVPYQLAPLSQLELTEEECQKAAQVVPKIGIRSEGYDAFEAAFRSSANLLPRFLAGLMRFSIVRFFGLFVYSRVAKARHTGALGDAAGACRLPTKHQVENAFDRSQGWKMLEASRPMDDSAVVDSLTRSRQEVYDEWTEFRRQLALVGAQWAIASLLLAIRIVYDKIVGYGWGWQMFS